jgi:RimJ/RimL family protein N-acetyltransferase
MRIETQAFDPTRFSAPALPNLASREFDLAGEELVMRELYNADLDEIGRHFLDLARCGRAARLTSASDEAVKTYLRRIDQSAATMIGAFAASGRRLVGIAEAQPTEKAATIEIAVTVAADYRRKGLARELVRRLVALAFAGGVRTVEFNFRPSNKPVIRIVSSLGGRFGNLLGQASITCARNFDR